MVLLFISGRRSKRKEKRERAKEENKRNQEHQTRIHTDRMGDEKRRRKKTAFFFGFLNRYKKVDDTRKSGTHAHAHTHETFCLFFFVDFSF